METLNLGEKLIIDESIEKHEYHRYKPEAGANLNQSGEIRISINSETLFLDINKSYLLFEGQLTKNDGTIVEDESTATKKEMTTLVNNGMMFLFSQIKYDLSGQTIESIQDPGITTTMMGLLKYSGDFEKGLGMNQLWCRERSWDARDGLKRRHNEISTQSDPKGYFSFKVPLKHIFGFCETYNKVLYGFTHLLTLNRKLDDSDVVIRETNEGTTNTITMVKDHNVRLDRLAWVVPHVEPNLQNKVSLMKQIERKNSFEVGYKMLKSVSISVSEVAEFDWRLSVKSSPEKPRYIIIGFQNKNRTNFNKATFDHLNLTNIYACLNDRRYPEIDYTINFKKNQYCEIFDAAATFKQKYYGVDEVLSCIINLTRTEYKEFYPLFVIDVSKQNAEIKNGVTDITITAKFAENTPKGTHAYAVLVSDRIVKFESDGSKFSVLQ